MAADEEDEGDEKGVRKYCTLYPVTIRRLEVLAKTKWYGPTVPKVIAGLIEEGLRSARERGYLTDAD